MSEKVLLIGKNVRNVAQSAKKAGYEVYAISKYLDADLFLYCERVYPIEGNLRAIAEEIAEKAKVVLCSGFETFKIDAELLCNDPKICENIVDKLKFYKILEKAGIPHPEILNKPEGRTIAKPRFGSGGTGIFFTEKEQEGYVLQKYIEGTPCSVSLIVGREITPISCNYIFSGWNEMNAEGFIYCGNLTPLKIEEEKKKELEKIAIEVVQLFELQGSVGVDFILSDKPYVLELNPRFQGSLDSIEWSFDVNLFSLHVRAFEGKRIEKVRPKRFAARAIYFSDRDIGIRKDLVGNPFYADIPWGFYRKGDPLVSILATGSLEEVYKKILERKKIFLNLILDRS